MTPSVCVEAHTVFRVQVIMIINIYFLDDLMLI